MNAPTESATPLAPQGNLLAAKVARVQAAIAAKNEQLQKRHVVVEISGGGSYSYDYIEESTLMNEIRLPVAQEGVAVFYSDRIVSLSGNLATVEVTLVLVDGESGEQFVMSAQGIGTDKGDKAVNKAKTAAMRYLLWKWFLVPSDIDPETENLERSDKPPRSQIKFAKKEDVDAFIAAVAAAGYDTQPTIEVIDRETQENEGVRQSFLDAQRKRLDQAIADAKKKAPQTAAEQASKDTAPEVPQA